MKVFYHGDMDGIASAYILCRRIIPQQTLQDFVSKNGDSCIMEFDYNKQIDLKELSYSSQEDAYFVDCSPTQDVLDYIITKVQNVFIIDHHASRGKMLKEYLKKKKIKGMFYDGASATLITHCYSEFVIKNKKDVSEVKEFLDWFSASRQAQDSDKVPLGIKLVNSWDIWNGFYIDAEPYKLVFESKKLHPWADRKIIDKMLFDVSTVAEAIRKGYIMKEQMDCWSNKYMEKNGYEVEYEGHKFFVANVGCANSKFFGDRIKNYDAVIPYCFNGNIWTYSIYSDSSTDFDCAEFATKFGGGGHKKAAGFTTKEKLF